MKELPPFCAPFTFPHEESEISTRAKLKKKSVWSKQALLEPTEKVLFDVSFTDTLTKLWETRQEKMLFEHKLYVCSLGCLSARGSPKHSSCSGKSISSSCLLASRCEPGNFSYVQDKSRTRPFRARPSIALKDVRFPLDPPISHCLD